MASLSRDLQRLSLTLMSKGRPSLLTKKVKVQNLRVYVSGTNLLCWSKFKLWDPEMAGNGLGYPIQRVINVGINLGF